MHTFSAAVASGLVAPVGVAAEALPLMGEGLGGGESRSLRRHPGSLEGDPRAPISAPTPALGGITPDPDPTPSRGREYLAVGFARLFVVLGGVNAVERKRGSKGKRLKSLGSRFRGNDRY